MKTIYESFSEDDTASVGAALAAKCRGGEVIKLSGGLGAGKTAFVKGFVKNAAENSADVVSSPTFSIMNIYSGTKFPIYHFDTYRVKNSVEFEYSVGLDYFEGNGVCLVEWAEIIEDVLPCTAISVFIENDPSVGGDYRKITVTFPD
ncbi:MAG: tRNA (adenosine(37)-N6)-threonylcarbamoyltransferase complex ATPase subunit type 1 TsaE [Clostridiales bacterium]|jgi:tRNA threonylcarbamoyladenosine biosynthesis protein TsaE|nr:tRNA (adenosine(37)-N6)-threonylcarbamoyltransferase complex ATPase subunit type 1 TsaE [Clostridiales bacterium]